MILSFFSYHQMKHNGLGLATEQKRAAGGPSLFLNWLLVSIKGGTVSMWAAERQGDFLLYAVQL